MELVSKGEYIIHSSFSCRNVFSLGTYLDIWDEISVNIFDIWSNLLLASLRFLKLALLGVWEDICCLVCNLGSRWWHILNGNKFHFGKQITLVEMKYEMNVPTGRDHQELQCTESLKLIGRITYLR